MPPKTILENGLSQRVQQAMAVRGQAGQRLGDFILQRPKDIIHLSISDLAASVGVSEATVVRFCQQMGYKGYQDFKIHLSQALVHPIKRLDSQIECDDVPETILRKVGQTLQQTIDDTVHANQAASLTAAIDALRKARRIVIFGTAGSAVTARDAAYRLLKLGLAVWTYEDYHTAVQASALLDAGDVVFFISHSGTTRDVLALARKVQEQNVTILAMTKLGRSPLAALADIVLVTSSPESSYRSEAVASRVGQLLLIDTLFVGLYLQDPQGSNATVQRTRQAVADLCL